MPTIWTDEDAEVGRIREEKVRRKQIREERERVRREKIKVHEDVG